MKRPIRETPARFITSDGWAYRLQPTEKPLTQKEQLKYIRTGELPKGGKK